MRKLTRKTGTHLKWKAKAAWDWKVEAKVACHIALIIVKAKTAWHRSS
jgi:hypothetical protein